MPGCVGRAQLSRKAVRAEFCGFLEMAKGFMWVNKYLKDKVISKQISKNKMMGMKWETQPLKRSTHATQGLINQEQRFFFHCLGFFSEGRFSPVRYTQ